MCASDDLCVKHPLIGVWTYGIDYSEEDNYESRKFIWSILTEFVKNRTIAERFVFD